MNALQYQRTGEPVDVVEPTDVPVPEVPQGYVRLRMVRSPIHNHDLATIRGTYGVKPKLPATGGSEMLGVVDAVGEGVTLAQGTRVATMAPGAWAQYALAPASALAPVPEAISDDAGAQLLAMPLSTVVLFDSLKLAPGEWLIQNAANGAVGRMLMRMAQSAGVNVLGLVRRRDAADELEGFGARHVVVTGDADWAEQIRKIVGDGKVTRVLDSVCDDQSIVLNRLLAPRGEHVIFGALAGRPLKLDPGALIFGETVVRGFWMTTWMKEASPADVMQAIGRVFALVLSGELPLPAGAVFPLSEAKAALKAAETPGRPGKVLFRP